MTDDPFREEALTTPCWLNEWAIRPIFAVCQPTANRAPLGGVLLVRAGYAAQEASLVRLPPSNVPPPSAGSLGPACDGADCQDPVTHQWAATNKRRAFKFCQRHSEKYLMGAGFEVRPDGWDR